MKRLKYSIGYKTDNRPKCTLQKAKPYSTEY